MVKQFDTNDAPDLLQAFRYLDVLKGRLRVAARMLMADDERRRIVENGGLEDFTWVDDTRVDTPEVCPMDSDDPILRVQQDDEEHLTVIVLDEASSDKEGRDMRRLEGDIRFPDLLADTGDFNEFGQFHGKAPFASGMQSDTMPSC